MIVFRGSPPRPAAAQRPETSDLAVGLAESRRDAPRGSDADHRFEHGTVTPDPLVPESAGFAAICPDGRSASVLIEPSQLLFRYANLGGRQLLRRHYPVRLRHGTLQVVSERGASLLRDAIRMTRHSARPAMIVADGEFGPFSIRVSLWQPDERRGGGSGDVAILDVRTGPIAFSPDDLEAFAKGFDLTPAETAVMGLLADGQTLAQIARRRGVELATVRRQCKAVLAKVGCHRQVDLIRLMVALCAGHNAVVED